MDLMCFLRFEEVHLKLIVLTTGNRKVRLPPVAEQEITLRFFFVLVGRRGEKNHIYSEHELFLASRTQAAAGH